MWHFTIKLNIQQDSTDLIGFQKLGYDITDYTNIEYLLFEINRYIG